MFLQQYFYLQRVFQAKKHKMFLFSEIFQFQDFLRFQFFAIRENLFHYNGHPIHNIYYKWFQDKHLFDIFQKNFLDLS